MLFRESREVKKAIVRLHEKIKHGDVVDDEVSLQVIWTEPLNLLTLVHILNHLCKNRNKESHFQVLMRNLETFLRKLSGRV